MSSETTYYNLVKPAQSDNYDVDDFNGNADIIDDALHSISENVEKKVDSPKQLSDAAFEEADQLAFRDVSADGLKRTTFSAIFAAIKSKFWGTVSGIPKIQSDGTMSEAQSGTDFQAPTQLLGDTTSITGNYLFPVYTSGATPAHKKAKVSAILAWLLSGKSGILKTNGSSLQSAVANEDYMQPISELSEADAVSDSSVVAIYDSDNVHKKAAFLTIINYLKTYFVQKINALSEASTLNDDSLFPAAVAGVEKKIKISTLRDKLKETFQITTEKLGAETVISDADVLPFFSQSANAARKLTFANLKTAFSILFDEKQDLRISSSTEQAIFDSQTGLKSVEDSLLRIFSKNKIQIGFYTGTNLFGANNPTEILCDFIPDIILIVPSAAMSRGETKHNIWESRTAVILRSQGLYPDLEIFGTKTRFFPSQLSENYQQIDSITSGSGSEARTVTTFAKFSDKKLSFYCAFSNSSDNDNTKASLQLNGYDEDKTWYDGEYMFLAVKN